MANNDFQFETGDILRFTPVPLHYAVYIGDGEIVHYNKPEGNWTKACILRETLEHYMERTSKSQVVKVTYKLSGKSKPPSEIRQRALAYVDERNYNPLIRNCEHFATWCVYGKAVSGNSRAAFMGGGIAVFTIAGGGVGAVVGGIVGSVVPVAGTVAGTAAGGAIGTGAGAAVGGVTAGVGWVINQIVCAFRKEEKKFK